MEITPNKHEIHKIKSNKIDKIEKERERERETARPHHYYTTPYTHRKAI